MVGLSLLQHRSVQSRYLSCLPGPTLQQMVQAASRFAKGLQYSVPPLMPALWCRLPAWPSLLQAVTNYTSLVNQNLRNQVTYQVWFVARDAVGNVQAQPTAVSVTTVRTAPPVFQSLLVQYIPPTTAYVEVSLPGHTQVRLCHPLVLPDPYDDAKRAGLASDNS